MYLREKIKEALCNELKTKSTRKFFSSNPLMPFQSFLSPEDLIEYLHNREKQEYERTDYILCCLIKACQADEGSQWLPLLSLVFWPAIESVFFMRRNQYMDDDDLFMDVYRAFCDVLMKYPVKRRSSMVAKNIKCGVLKLVCRRQKLSCRHYQITRLAREAARLHRKNHPFGELSTQQSLTEDDYWNFAGKGIITQTDCLLLLGTRIYGRSLREQAERQNLSYEAARKRRQRAEQILQEK